MKDEFYVPANEDVATQSTDNKQGRSAEPLPPAEAEAVRAALAEAQRESYADYAKLVEGCIARELARINLPLSLYTEWYWQIDLHNLFHFLELRLDAHAQKEIRAYAEVLLDITRCVAPRCSESFTRHMLGAVSFSADEFAELKRRLATAVGNAQGENTTGGTLSSKALERFEEKLATGRQK
jgi:thymidylate synthase (FAD)